MSKTTKKLPDPSAGGRARAESLSAEERSRIARRAANTRWARDRANKAANEIAEISTPVAHHRGYLNLLDGVDLPCYVLSDGRRVIGRTSATEMLTGIKGGGDLEKYLGVQAFQPFVDGDYVSDSMVSFSLPEVEGLGKEVKGLPADLLIDICRGMIEALTASERDDSGLVLTGRQREIALRAGQFLSACAKTGLDALIDEATGYQYERAEDALQIKLRAYLEDEMRPWEKTFPDELWMEFGRLTGWKGPLSKRPKYWGNLVMELVYDYLDPDVALWLRENAPKPRHGSNYHQWLTSQYGLKKLVEHLWKLIGISKTCHDLPELKQKMAHLHGRQGVQYTLYLPPPS